MFKANENVILKANENIYCLFSFSLLTRCRLSNICFSCVAALSPERATDGAEICLPIVSAAATSLTSAKNECCITLPNESTTATAAAALNNGMKRAVNVMRLAFTTGASISASTRTQMLFLLKLLIYKQILITRQVFGNVLFCKESTQLRFFLKRSLTLPITF